MITNSDYTREEWRVMMAAPDLLAACKEAIAPLEEGGFYEGEVLEVLATVREAIAKAEGHT